MCNLSAPPPISTLSLHDALPISVGGAGWYAGAQRGGGDAGESRRATVELHSRRVAEVGAGDGDAGCHRDRKSTRLNSSHLVSSYAVFCLKKQSCKQSTLTARDGE